MSGKYRKDHDCLNCGQHVEKHYCSSCGQANFEIKENFWQFISHSIAHYFHFDNKFFQTLKPLLTKPGQVTLDYLAGKRARYINPVSMYIFVSIVYFIVVPNKLHHDKETQEHHNSAKDIRSAAENIKMNLKGEGINENSFIEKSTSYLQEKLDKQEFKSLTFQQQTIAINNLKHEIDSLKTDEFDNLLSVYKKYHVIKQDSTYESYIARQQKLEDKDRDSWFTRLLKKREISINQKSSSGNWSVKEELEHYRPKQYFLLMPLLALFIMWNFRKNHIYYLDHLIFTVHGTTAFFIVQIFTVPLRRDLFGSNTFMGEMIQLAVILGIAWYMFTALTVFYQRPKKVIIKKMVTLIVMYFIAFALSEWVIENAIYYFIG